MERRIQSIKPLIFLVLANIVGMILVTMQSEESYENMGKLCLIMCGVNIVAYVLINLIKLGDNYLFIIISMLSSIGIIMQTRINQDNGLRQMKLYLAGVLCFFFALWIYKTYQKYWKKLWFVYFPVSVVLFLITAIFGTEKYGSKNWIIIGGISIQPSEFIRILFVLSIASVLTSFAVLKTDDEKTIKTKKMKRLLLSSLIAYVNAGFLLLQREWGIALLFFAIYLSFLYIYGRSKTFLSLNIIAALLAGYLGVRFLSHIQVRVSVWLNPFEDINGKGYQIMQSLFAIGTGGFSGSGIGSGSPYFIPVVSSDFIFSAICEEMGVLGGTAVLLLYFLLVYRGFKIALSCTNTFNKAVSMGLSVMLGVQTFIIVGGVIKLIPLTGITLPFISYGGSSMITTFAALGILQAISAMKEEYTDELK